MGVRRLFLLFRPTTKTVDAACRGLYGSQERLTLSHCSRSIARVLSEGVSVAEPPEGKRHVIVYVVGEGLAMRRYTALKP